MEHPYGQKDQGQKDQGQKDQGQKGRMVDGGGGPPTTERARRWAGTMAGHGGGATVRRAHADSAAAVGTLAGPVLRRRVDREELEAATLAPGATRASGAGRREREEEPDELRTCFERDRDRILHSPPFRRLAGKTQVFVFPDDHQRTRLTHALEVAQVAVSVAAACGLNVPLTEAIALGHDCGHGPGGHASEDALEPYLAEGFDHAVWGADTVLTPLNLCAETLDGVRNHSWSRPAPSTPEGEVVSWSDRIAYVCHDFEDAVSAGIVTEDVLPRIVAERCGTRRSHQLSQFIAGMIRAISTTGQVGLEDGLADALSEFRGCNYRHVYLRPASVAQSRSVIDVLRALVDHFADRPNLLRTGRGAGLAAGSDPAVRAAVDYVAGMTDRFAFDTAIAQLGWDPQRLPAGVAFRG
jgi:dGTPase